MNHKGPGYPPSRRLVDWSNQTWGSGPTAAGFSGFRRCCLTSQADRMFDLKKSLRILSGWAVRSRPGRVDVGGPGCVAPLIAPRRAAPGRRGVALGGRVVVGSPPEHRLTPRRRWPLGDGPERRLGRRRRPPSHVGGGTSRLLRWPLGGQPCRSVAPERCRRRRVAGREAHPRRRLATCRGQRSVLGSGRGKIDHRSILGGGGDHHPRRLRELAGVPAVGVVAPAPGAVSRGKRRGSAIDPRKRTGEDRSLIDFRSWGRTAERLPGAEAERRCQEPPPAMTRQVRRA